jgi:hypothetical protein
MVKDEEKELFWQPIEAGMVVVYRGSDQRVYYVFLVVVCVVLWFWADEEGDLRDIVVWGCVLVRTQSRRIDRVDFAACWCQERRPEKS